MATAIDTWNSINAVIIGDVAPSATPIAFLTEDEREHVVAEIETAMAAIEHEVTQKFPDLDDENQRAERLHLYKMEYLSRQAVTDRKVCGDYFDVLMGIYIGNASSARSYTIDSCGCYEPAA